MMYITTPFSRVTNYFIDTQLFTPPLKNPHYCLYFRRIILYLCTYYNLTQFRQIQIST